MPGRGPKLSSSRPRGLVLLGTCRAAATVARPCCAGSPAPHPGLPGLSCRVSLPGRPDRRRACPAAAPAALHRLLLLLWDRPGGGEGQVPGGAAWGREGSGYRLWAGTGQAEPPEAGRGAVAAPPELRPGGTSVLLLKPLVLSCTSLSCQLLLLGKSAQSPSTRAWAELGCLRSGLWERVDPAASPVASRSGPRPAVTCKCAETGAPGLAHGAEMGLLPGGFSRPGLAARLPGAGSSPLPGAGLLHLLSVPAPQGSHSRRGRAVPNEAPRAGCASQPQLHAALLLAGGLQAPPGHR